MTNEFFTWAVLLTYAGATLATSLVTQLIKGVGFIDKIPTRLTSYGRSPSWGAWIETLGQFRCAAGTAGAADSRQKRGWDSTFFSPPYALIFA